MVADAVPRSSGLMAAAGDTSRYRSALYLVNPSDADPENEQRIRTPDHPRLHVFALRSLIVCLIRAAETFTYTDQPSLQIKVQAYIDEMVGRDRMPTSDDLDQLPYIRAFVLEILRWRGIARFGWSSVQPRGVQLVS